MCAFQCNALTVLAKNSAVAFLKAKFLSVREGALGCYVTVRTQYQRCLARSASIKKTVVLKAIKIIKCT